MEGDILTVLIEYSPKQKRVFVRGVWKGNAGRKEPLEPDNQQNYVQVFEGLDMKQHIGFTGLIPDNS